MAKTLILASLIAVGWTGCGRPPVDKPPAIRYGMSRCTECGMIISEERFSAAALGNRGEPLLFDDIGCLFHFYQKQDTRPARFWVRDSENLDWIEGKPAYFVVSSETPSPMGYNLSAYALKDEAEEFADAHSGHIESYNTLIEGTVLAKTLPKKEP